MPRPKPMMDEDHQDWMDRCMSNSAMMDDHPDGDARSTQCEIMWDDAGKSSRGPSGVKHFTVPAQFKATGDAGAFSGYASIFENVDLGGDVIRKGAFKEFVTNESGQVKVLFQHDSGGGWVSGGAGGLPIGLAAIEQNSKGLKFDGKLVMDDPFVQRVHAHMKAGTLDGMSIGYDVMPGGAKIMESGVRELTALKLWEISAVTFGMNPKARIDAVKSVQQITSIREFENFLRESGFSKTQAVAIASGGWKTLQDRRDSGEADDAKEYLKFLNSLTEKST